MWAMKTRSFRMLWTIGGFVLAAGGVAAFLAGQRAIGVGLVVVGLALVGVGAVGGRAGQG
jgi:hypothetical protein